MAVGVADKTTLRGALFSRHPIRRLAVWSEAHPKISKISKWVATPFTTAAATGALYDIGTMAPTASGLLTAASVGLLVGAGISRTVSKSMKIALVGQRIERLAGELSLALLSAETNAENARIAGLQAFHKDRDLQSAQLALRTMLSDTVGMRDLRVAYSEAETEKGLAVRDLVLAREALERHSKTQQPGNVGWVRKSLDLHASLETLEALVRQRISRLADLEGQLVENGGIEIVREIGKGGMGTVFLGRSKGNFKPLAVKVISTLGATDPDVIFRRFQTEATSMASLVHPFIARVYAFMDVLIDGSPVKAIIQEYVNGKSLASWIENDLLDREQKLNIILMIAEGLKAAHDQNIIHRDIKPDNILLAEHEGPSDSPTSGKPGENIVAVKIIDFGLARVVDGGSERVTQDLSKVSGTPLYMPPEQFVDMGKVEKPGDIYAFGRVAYELIKGETSPDGLTPVTCFQRAQRPLFKDVEKETDPLNLLLFRMAHPQAPNRPTIDVVIEELKKIISSDTLGTSDTVSVGKIN